MEHERVLMGNQNVDATLSFVVSSKLNFPSEKDLQHELRARLAGLPFRGLSVEVQRVNGSGNRHHYRILIPVIHNNRCRHPDLTIPAVLDELFAIEEAVHHAQNSQRLASMAE